MVFQAREPRSGVILVGLPAAQGEPIAAVSLPLSQAQGL
jgi:hypothetical protein